jgi:hypothetical protein
MHLASKEITHQALAYREAGYTVACWSLNLRVKRATITSGNKPSEFLSWLRAAQFSCNSGLSRRSFVRYHDRIVCALAGRQAQRRVAPQSVKSRDANGDDVRRYSRLAISVARLQIILPDHIRPLMEGRMRPQRRLKDALCAPANASARNT